MLFESTYLIHFNLFLCSRYKSRHSRCRRLCSILNGDRLLHA